MMKIIVLVLTLMAAGKVYMHYNFYRVAADAAIISAYKGKAIAACQKGHQGVTKATARFLWKTPGHVAVEVGNAALDISVWQIEHPNWEQRYRQASLVLTPADKLTKTRCRFDLKTGKTKIS